MTSFFSSSMIFWSVLCVIHLPILGVPFLYWRQRHLDPINVRRPRILIIPLVTLVIAVWHILIRGLFQLSAESWVNVLVLSILLVATSESFFVFALSLYIAYNKMKRQIALYQECQRSSDMESLKVFLSSIRLISSLLSEQFAYAWIIGHVVIWTMVIVMYIGSQIGFPDCKTSLSSISEAKAGRVMNMVYGRCFVTVFFWVVLSWRLRLVQDAFGTKSLLKKTGLIGVFSLLYHFLLEKYVAQVCSLRLQDACTLLLVDIAFIIAFIIPLWQTYTTAASTAQVTSNISGSTSHFEAFLHTADGFEAFQSYLEKEFAVENLLFWKDVNLFKESCDADEAGQLSPKSVAMALEIYEKYLCSSALLEINLPCEQSIMFRHIFQNRIGDNPGIASSIFDEASRQVFQLMESDSLRRFLKTNPPSWNQFTALYEERMVVNQVDEFAKKSREHTTSENCEC